MTEIPFRDLLLAPRDLYPEAIADVERDCLAVPAYRPLPAEHPMPNYRAGILEIDLASSRGLFFDLAPYERRRECRNGPRDIFGVVWFGLAFYIAIAVFLFEARPIIDAIAMPPGEFADASKSTTSLGIAIGLSVAIAAVIGLPFLIRAWVARRRLDDEILWAAEVEVPSELLAILRGEMDDIEEIEHAPSPDPESSETLGKSIREGIIEGVAKGLGGDLAENAVKAARAATKDEAVLRKLRKANQIRRRAVLRILHFHRLLTGREPVRVSGAEWAAGVEFADSRFLARPQAMPEPVG